MFLRTLAFLFFFLTPLAAHAACSSPAGNEGDINYSSAVHTMVYCNNTSWINMGVSSPVTFGTLTTNDFCTATSGTAIACTTATIGVANGGTGDATLTSNGVLYGNTTGAVQATAQGGANTILTANSGAPAWSAAFSIINIITGVASTFGRIASLKRLARCSGMTRIE